MNLLIGNARRVGYGFRNFENYRLRLLLACAIKWQTPPSPESEAANHAPPRKSRERSSARTSEGTPSGGDRAVRITIYPPSAQRAYELWVKTLRIDHGGGHQHSRP